MKEVNTELTKESQAAGFADISRLQQAQYKLENHKQFNDILPSTSVAHSQQVPMRVCVLYDYLTNFLQTFLADLHHPQESYIRKKRDAYAFVKKSVLTLDHELSPWDEDAEEVQDEDVYLASSSADFVFPKGFIAYDRNYALQLHQQIIKDKDKAHTLRPCACKVLPARKTKY